LPLLDQLIERVDVGVSRREALCRVLWLFAIVTACRRKQLSLAVARVGSSRDGDD
jgi:hypothetical protein